MGEALKPRVPNARKIAVLRAGALGDLIFTLPALDALRAVYPGAEIVLLGRAWMAKRLHER
ncbi:MAG TPA: glycosyltransferase family 9 protein, partial [Casimicrobiaceae bacterium]|nr:glycosyltransferase family 9 protein [Casimicrobiaceae bacterium]